MKSETLSGWKCTSHESYPDTMIIECACGHTSIRDRDEVADHTCRRSHGRARCPRRSRGFLLDSRSPVIMVGSAAAEMALMTAPLRGT